MNFEDTSVGHSGPSGIAIGEKGVVLLSFDWGMSWKKGGQIWKSGDGYMIYRVNEIIFNKEEEYLEIILGIF